MTRATGTRRDPAAGARSVARKLALQALYRLQLNDGPWQDLVTDFRTEEDMARADETFFVALVQGIAVDRVALDERLAAYTDRNRWSSIRSSMRYC